MLEKYLDDLEERIDGEEEGRLNQSWLDFIEGRHGGGRFVPQGRMPKPASVEWPRIPINRALEDVELMALRELANCSAQLAAGSGQVLCARANYGTGILPMLFGVEPFIMDESADTLPTTRPVEGGAAGLRRLVSRGVPDLSGGFGGRVFEAGALFARIAEYHPKIGRHVRVYHPDLQGPLDVCELLAGSALFLLTVDEPALVRDLLALVTETYGRFMRKWLELWPYNGSHSAHWGWLIGGCLMLRNDSMMNLSPSFYEESVMPFDQRLLDEFGGGAMHFCGRGDHYIALASALRGLTAVNMSQPQYNRVEHVLRHTVGKGVRLLGYDESLAPGSLNGLGESERLVHCIV